MTDKSNSNTCMMGYLGSDADLVLEEGAANPAVPQASDAYWKIGITVADLDQAVRWLDSQNWPVSRPRQFQDIGYLCHLQDPDGLSIELLQHGFDGNTGVAPDGHAIGAQATTAHLTLRVNDLPLAKDYSSRHLGLSLMSVQPVSDYGFSLYFYGPGTEQLPTDDLKSVSIREWLWRRPYTLLELQHLEQPVTLTHSADDVARFTGFGTFDGETGSYHPFAELALR